MGTNLRSVGSIRKPDGRGAGTNSFVVCEGRFGTGGGDIKNGVADLYRGVGDLRAGVECGR